MCSRSVMSDSFVTPTDCSLPGSSDQGILQARTLEWVAISFSRGSRDQTQVFLVQGSNPGLLHWQVDSLPSEPPRKPNGWVAFHCMYVLGWPNIHLGFSLHVMGKAEWTFRPTQYYISLPTHLVMDMEVASMSWLLWMARLHSRLIFLLGKPRHVLLVMVDDTQGRKPSCSRAF